MAKARMKAKKGTKTTNGRAKTRPGTKGRTTARRKK